jgi:hypothetical protein
VYSVDSAGQWYSFSNCICWMLGMGL